MLGLCCQVLEAVAQMILPRRIEAVARVDL